MEYAIMRKKQIFIGVVCFLMLQSNIYGFSLNDAVSDTVGDITGGITEHFGLPNFSVKCDIGVPNIDLYDMCGVVNKLNLSLGGEFKIGSCTIKTADPLSCQRRALLDLCRSSIRDGEDSAGNYRASAVNSIMSSSEELLDTGGKIVGNFANCNYIKNMFSSKKTSSGRTLKEIYSESMIRSVKENGIFSTANKEIQECLKVEKDEDKCFALDTWSLPKTMQKAEEDISKTAEQSNTNSTSYIDGIIGTENQLSSQMTKKCKNASNPSTCIKNVLKDKKNNHVEKRDAAISNIEKASSIRFNVLKSASRRKKAIVYRGTAISNKLPIELRTDYISAAARANAADVVVTNLYSANVGLEKEAMIILDNKVVDASEPFLQKASNEQIKKLMGD